MREREYVELSVAAVSDPRAVLGSWLTQEAGGPWRADAARLPKMAAAQPRVRADVYADEGWVNVAFAGLAPGDAWLDGELGALLEAVAAREDARGASVALRNDTGGETVRVLAVAGHDAGEAAMALLDAWAPELELGYGSASRESLVSALRIDGIARRLGGSLEKRAQVVIIRNPTHDAAATLAEEIRPLTLGTAGTPSLP